MSTGAIIGIIIAAVVVVAIVAVASMLLRRTRMRRQFGPEYDRLAKEIGPRKAEAELIARQRRVEALGIHPLSAEQQARYSGDWAVIQERFVCPGRGRRLGRHADLGRHAGPRVSRQRQERQHGGPFCLPRSLP